MTNKITESKTLGKMDVWNAVKTPPENALKKIKGGRLSGMSDINPQWRYQALTELFGACGIGWKYEIVRVWNEPASDEQVMAFAQVNLYVKNEIEQWSDPIPGIGGSMFIAKEKAGLHSSDECYKMAVTDALSVACKMLGVAADVYAGMMDGSKYHSGFKRQSPGKDKKQSGVPKATDKQLWKISELAKKEWPETKEDELKKLINEIKRWVRQGDYLTVKDASDWISNWDDIITRYFNEAGQGPDDYDKPPIEDEPPF